MRVLIISDIHGNILALETVLKKHKDVDKIINLGDTVNYGPWSNECVLLLDSLDQCINVLGNHDKYFLEGCYPGENVIAKAFFNHCFPDFIAFSPLNQYKDRVEYGSFVFTHTIEEKIIFQDTVIEIDSNYVIGHSHQQFKRHEKGFCLYNPGSLGQNRRLINISEYFIWDTKRNEFEQFNFAYNFEALIKEMKKKKFPDICIDYYLKKEKG